MPCVKPANYEAYCKASWSLGNDPPCTSSTYYNDYSKARENPLQYADLYAGEKAVKRFPKSTRRVLNPLIVTPPMSPSFRSTVQQRPVKQKTAISFGNDIVNKVSAYQEFAGQQQCMPRLPACTPIKATDITSMPCTQTSGGKRSCLHNDYRYYGTTTADQVFGQRQLGYDAVKAMHSHDSVDRTLLGRRRKMLTRSMVDYKHPLESLKGCSVKKLMVTQISPQVREDHIWSSVNNGGRNSGITEVSCNYGWPHPSIAMPRFHPNCYTR